MMREINSQPPYPRGLECTAYSTLIDFHDDGTADLINVWWQNTTGEIIHQVTFFLCRSELANLADALAALGAPA